MSFWKRLAARWGGGAGETDDVRMDASTNSLQTVGYEHHEIHSNSHYFIEDFAALGVADIDFCFTTSNIAKWPHLIFAFDALGTMQLDMYERATLVANTGTLIVQRGDNRAKCFAGTHTPVGASATIMTDATATFTVDALIDWKIYNITDGSYGIITDNDGTTVTVAALVGGAGDNWEQDDEYEINQSLSILRSEQTITDIGIRMGGQSAGDATNPNQGIPGGSKRENELVLRQNTSYVFRFTSGIAGNILTYRASWYEHEDKH